MKRKNPLANGETYHIFSKSIAEFKIFNSDTDYQRMLNLIKYYQIEKPPEKFSRFIQSEPVRIQGFANYFDFIGRDQKSIVQILAYCLMPTHIHLILKQLSLNGISIFMSNILNSYSRFFNTLHHRKGPLWENKFQNILVEKDEQLLHLTRYIHLNPVTAFLVEQPDEWLFSSYKEYIQAASNEVCQYEDMLEIKPNKYIKFVKDRTSDQRELAKIKKVILD